MATYLTGELRPGRVALSSKKGMLTVQETYHAYIHSDDPQATRLDILQTTGLPIPYQTVSPTNLGLCISVDLERHEKAAKLWKATFTYSSDVEDGSGSGGNPNSDPLSWVPLRETYLEPYEEVLIRDLDGNEFVNGAGTPFDTAPTISRDNIRWDFFQFENIADVTDDTIRDRNNTINSEVFLGCAKHTLKLKVRRSVVGAYYGRYMRLSEYSIIWKESNWHEKIANYGDSFRYNNKVWPYIYSDNKDVIHKGPLGIKDYLYDEAMDARGGLPTGDNTSTVSNCIETVGTTTYAKPPTNPKLYFIERRVCEQLDFNQILRVV